MSYRKAIVRLAGHYEVGKDTITAYASPSGVFAVHRYLGVHGPSKFGWVVTHVPTGKQVSPGGGFDTLPSAKRFVELLETHDDADVWTDPRLSFNSEPDDVTMRERMRAVYRDACNAAGV